MKKMLGLALGLAAVCAAAPALALDNPYQGRVGVTVPAGVQAVKSSQCNHDPANKCTFSVKLDFDGDGLADTAYMANYKGQGLIIVSFGKRSKVSIVAASFRTSFDGNNYISRVKSRPDKIGFTEPEASYAEIVLRNGKPTIKWLGD